MTTPQMPYPYTKGARIFLAPGAAERLARYQGLRIVLDDDGKPQKREKPKEPVTELEAQRIAVLPGGWLRAEIVFEEDVTPVPGSLISWSMSFYRLKKWSLCYTVGSDTTHPDTATTRTRPS